MILNEKINLSEDEDFCCSVLTIDVKRKKEKNKGKKKRINIKDLEIKYEYEFGISLINRALSLLVLDV